MSENLQQENFASRVETLTVLFNRFIEKSKMLDGHSAIVFTQPMCDILLRALHQLETYEENKRIDELLGNILNDDTKQ